MNIMLKWATGSGKTKEALDRTVQVIRSPSSDYSILIVVGETQHKQNWKDEMKKWGFNLNATIICYASLKKYRSTKHDVLILDECHHCSSVLRQNILHTIKADNVFALSATPGESLQILQRLYGHFEVSTKGLNSLIKTGRLPKPEVFVYDLRLSEEHPEGCTLSEKDRYNLVESMIRKYRGTYARTHFLGDKFKMLQAGLERKRLLGELKIPYVSYLLNKIDDKRYICFCPTIEIARKLYTLHPVGSACINSKEPSKTNEENLAAFNNGDKDHLFVVGMLTEGTNLENIEAGVLMQLDRGERTMIQKFGRTMRSEHPKMYFFRFLDTVDDKLVKNIAWNLDSQYLTNVEFHRRLLHAFSQ